MRLSDFIEDLVGALDFVSITIDPNRDGMVLVKQLQSIANRTDRSFPVYHREGNSKRLVEWIVPQEIGGEG